METIPFHAGELQAQEKAGEQAIGLKNGKIISNTIIPGAVKFIENQSFFIASTRDEAGKIWTSIVAGKDGLVKVPDSSTICIYPDYCYSNPDDVFWKNINKYTNLGLLFIELSTRRRFRVNGKVIREKNKLSISIDQAYPNCPKYIQKRHLNREIHPAYTVPSLQGTTLTDELVALIASSDTFFVGSSNLSGDMDASHRGGLPGFIHVKDYSTLIIPDYSGNSMFNTLGNFIENPQAGLLFLDFNGNRSVQLTGKAKVSWHGAEYDIPSGGTNRCWTFNVDQWICIENFIGLERDLVEYSPFNPK